MLSLCRRGCAILVPVAFLASCADQTLPTESGSPAAAPAAVSSAAAPDLTSGVPLGKTDVCHRRGRGDYIVINVNWNSVPAHRGHGDGLPGDPVPGESSMVFSDACVPTLACTYSDLAQAPSFFTDQGGQGTITYLMSSPSCECSGASDQEWLQITGSQVQSNECTLSTNVDFAGSALTETRTATVTTPAGDILVPQQTTVIIGDDDNPTPPCPPRTICN